MRSLRAGLGSVAVDVVVVAFVATGRDAHHHAEGLAGIAATSWPFLAGLAVGWSAVAAAWAGGARPGLLRTGLVAWPTTVGVGMSLRVAAGQGTAVAFVLAALACLGAFLLGWRPVALMVWSRRLGGGRLPGWATGGRPASAGQAGAGVEMPTPPRVSEP